jgi:hypothetical protein
VWGDPLRQFMWAVKKTNVNPPGADNEVVKIVFQVSVRACVRACACPCR